MNQSAYFRPAPGTPDLATRARFEEARQTIRWRPLISAALVLGTMLGGTVTHAAGGTGPVIRLFPTTVVEDIKHTGSVAEAMESGLQDIIGKLDLQQQLFTESHCAQADDDPGCGQIAKQLGATYLEMLEAMNTHLPEMEKAVESTRGALERRLREELGQSTTPSGLQDLLLGEATAKTEEARKLALRGRSGLRLSDRFSRYYNLVATNGRGASGQSLALVASDIYLDMAEASQLIAATRQEIARATLMEQLNQSFGVITPEMEQVVAGVKSILFGEQSNAPPIPAGPSKVETAYRSPLAM